MSGNDSQELMEDVITGLRDRGVITAMQRNDADILCPSSTDARLGLEINGRHYVITIEDVSS